MFVFPGKPEEEYRRQLGSFGVSGELALRPIDSLSGGQKSRVAFAILGMLRYGAKATTEGFEPEFCYSVLNYE